MRGNKTTITIMKDTIINTIKNIISKFHIAKLSTNESISLVDIETLCDNINNALYVKYRNDEIQNKVTICATPHKYEEKGDNYLEAVDANGWDDAEELNLFMSIERPRPRKDKKLHEEIVKESISILKNVIPMNFFADTFEEEVWQENYDNMFQSMSMICFYMPCHYENHKKFHM